MLNLWFKHLPTREEQEVRKKFVVSNKKLLDFLDEILYNMSIGEENLSKDQYDSPSWAFIQADRNGYLRALRDVRKLCKLKEI